MSQYPATPIVDRNGKHTTVHRKPEAEVSSRMVDAAPVALGNDGGTINPATGAPYPIGLTNANVEVAMNSFLENLIWTGTHTEVDEAGNEGDTVELDSLGFTHNDFSEDAMTAAEDKVLGFISDNPELVREALDRDNYNIDSFANDLSLTINGHGTGFWDRDELKEGELGEKLTEASRISGGLTVYVGDDGQLHL